MKGGPCDPPTAILTSAQGDTIRTCPGDSILLDGSASYAPTGHIIQQWAWNLGNGELDTTTTPFLTVGFPEGGYRAIGLQVIDEAGCASDSMAMVPALVSRRPSFLGTVAPDTICQQMITTLTGTAV